MITRFSLTVLAFSLVVEFAFSQSLSPSKREEVLAQLNNLEDIVNGKRVSIRKTAVGVFQQAASSGKAASDLYEKCQKVIEPDKSEKEFREERERQERRLGYNMKDSNAEMALQAQLQFLVISLRHAEGIKLEVLLPEIEKLVDNIVLNRKVLGPAYEILRRPVNNSLFAQVYELDDSLNLENWCFTPGDHRAMYNGIILPYYRENDKKSLGAAWDKLISMDKFAYEARNEDDEEKIEDYRTNRVPELHWQKSVDLYEHGFQESSAAAMLTIIRADPDHPHAGKRITELRRLLSGQSKTTSEGS